MKKFLFGFILGSIFFGTAAFAAVELKVVPNPFPVLINGTETAVEGYNINGYTFLKLADFKKAGLMVKFNETDSQIEIINDSLLAANDIIESEVKSEGDGEMGITQTPDGITQIDIWEGKQYIGFSYIRNAIQLKGYDLIQEKPSRVWKLVKGDEVLIDNVPTTVTYGYNSIEVNYYINTILPLIT